jgi:serine/threonine protein kinase
VTDPAFGRYGTDVLAEGASAARTVADRTGLPREPGRRAVPFGAESFRGYPVVRPLSSEGGEADIMVIRDGEGREYVLRLYREGREPAPGVMERLVALSSRRSPWVVNTYQAGLDEASGRHYEIQEYLPEGDLEAWARGRRIGPSEFRELASQLAEAVAIVHGEGLVHRDIKPDNILLRTKAPLRVALADFGISSAMDPSGQSRETRTAATPLYCPPESFAGFAGPAGDWWGLGAVLLECAAGTHPLAGLPLNMVMREIGSRGLAVPEDLDPACARLLKGLLTRDDRRRWGRAEVSAWLDGRRDVPVFYEADLQGKQGDGAGWSRPFTFMGEAYRSPGDLAAAFAAGPEAWDPAAAALSRGLVRDWMEDNRAYDEAVMADSAGLPDPDLSLYSFILLFGPDLGHVWRGERLSVDLFSEILTSPDNPPHRERTAEDLVSGRLRALPAEAERRGHRLPVLLRTLLETAPEAPVSSGLTREPTVEWPPRGAPDAAGVPPVSVAKATGAGGFGAARGLYAAAILAARFPRDYVWGLAAEPPPDAECMRTVISSGVMPVNWKWYGENILPRFPLPEEIFRGLGGEPPGRRAASEGLVRAASLIRDGADGPCIFYRRRKAKAQGREVVLSPLGLTDWSRYFEYRLAIARGGGSVLPSGYYRERLIREREEAAGAENIRPFRGRWAWAGNWGPLAAAAFWIFWALVARKQQAPPRTLEDAFHHSPNPMPIFLGDGFYVAGLFLSVIWIFSFWAAASFISERHYRSIRFPVTLGLVSMMFLVLVGPIAMDVKMVILAAHILTLFMYRHILGIMLKRRILMSGGDLDS